MTTTQGGGSTFGVIISVTIKAFPSTEFFVASVLLGTPPGGAPFWDVITKILSQYPSIDSQGISAYTFVVTNFTSAELVPALNLTTPVDGFYGTFILPSLHPFNTSDSLLAAINNVFNNATSPYPDQFYLSVNPASYPSFWAWYKVNNGPLSAGGNAVLGSRLLDEKALTQNLTALQEALKIVTPPGGSVTQLYLVGGKGVMNAKPRGGSNAVNPAWRRAYVHAGKSVGWFEMRKVLTE